jgi:general secretion pathway protein I
MKARGFTLIEVMVALAVLAIALSAVTKGVSQNTANLAYLRDRTLAHWVAMNKIAELQIRRDWPGPGATQGTSDMAGREWQWMATVKDTPDADVRLLEVEVSAKTSAGRDSQPPLTHLLGYLGKPQTAP